MKTVKNGKRLQKKIVDTGRIFRIVHIIRAKYNDYETMTKVLKTIDIFENDKSVCKFCSQNLEK